MIYWTIHELRCPFGNWAHPSHIWNDGTTHRCQGERINKEKFCQCGQEVYYQGKCSHCLFYDRDLELQDDNV